MLNDCAHGSCRLLPEESPSCFPQPFCEAVAAVKYQRLAPSPDSVLRSIYNTHIQKEKFFKKQFFHLNCILRRIKKASIATDLCPFNLMAKIVFETQKKIIPNDWYLLFYDISCNILILQVQSDTSTS